MTRRGMCPPGSPWQDATSASNASVGPLPDVAGHVVQPVAVGGERADGGGAAVTAPGELALPGVRHPRVGLVAPRVRRALQAAARGELPLRLGRECRTGPRGVGHGVLVGDVHDRVACARVGVAARALRAAPGRARHVVPPPLPVVQGHRAARGTEDERAGDQHLGIGIGVVGGVGHALGQGDVAGLADEAPERGDGHRLRVDPEPRDLDAPDRALLGVEVLAAHEERARRDPGHARPGRRLRLRHRWTPPAGR